jgi:DNA-binding NarL/FixJ family response regulator
MRQIVITEVGLSCARCSLKSANPREVEIIQLLAEGKAIKEIAAMLRISVRTVETHRSKIMIKLGLHSLAELIHYAIRHGIATVQESQV